MVPEANKKRRSRWLVAAGAIAAVVVVIAVAAVVIAFTWFDVSLSDGIGDRAYAPTSAAAVRREYKLGVGSLELDLSRVPVGPELHVEARVGIGNLRVIVPRRSSVVVDARVKAGSISSLGRHDDGRNARVRITGGDKLFLEARVGAGRIEVERTE
jgi:Cell wall-active antibiotics response 4TMS YvqF